MEDRMQFRQLVMSYAAHRQKKTSTIFHGPLLFVFYTSSTILVGNGTGEISDFEKIFAIK